MQNNTYEIDADSAQTDPELDQLGYKSLAKTIAAGIDRMAPTEGIILAVKGGWGFGKTTTINYIIRYLKDMKSIVQPVEFNPWWFSGHEDLVRRLLMGISGTVKPETKEGKALADAVGDLVEAVDSIPFEWKPQLLGFSFDLKKLFIDRVKKLRAQKDIPSIKAHVGQALRDAGVTVLFVIDDVDRLSVDEIRDLFRAIKAVGNLPNVIYLLALDPEVVSQALDQPFSGKGKEYLEKIIQVPFHLPQPRVEGIAGLVSTGIFNILEHLEVQHFDQSRFAKLYRLGLIYVLRSPRDVVRLLNALKVTLPAVTTEVNHSDFIAIESLRLFLPQVYEVIRSNKDEFSDLLSITYGRDYASPLKVFHDSWIEQIPIADREWLKDFLMELFPKLRTAWKNSFQDESYLKDWRKTLRVCSPDIFDAYFRFAPPDNTISAIDLNMVLSDLRANRSVEYLRAKIKSDLSQDKNWIWNLFNRLEDHIQEEVPPPAAETLFCLIMEAWRSYKDSPDVKPVFSLIPGNQHILNNLLWNLFKRINAERRKTVCISALKAPFAMMPMTMLIRDAAQEHGKFKGSIKTEPVINSADLAEISEVFGSMVQERIDKGEITDAEELGLALHMFEAVQESRTSWLVSKLQETYDGCVALMSLGAQTTTGFSTRSGPTLQFLINLERIRSVVEPSHLVSMAESIVDANEQSVRSKGIASAFLECLRSGTGTAVDFDSFGDEDDASWTTE